MPSSQVIERAKQYSTFQMCGMYVCMWLGLERECLHHLLEQPLGVGAPQFNFNN